MSFESWGVIPLSKKQCDLFITRKHYSRRAPVFWEGFGLIDPSGLVMGVCVYGQPSPPVSRFSFEARDFRLYELVRLVVQTEKKNAASFLVGTSLKMLSEQPSAVVSYADTEWGHSGIVYQSTNWLYTGATKSHDHAYLVDGKRTHPMTLRDQGITDPKRWAADNGIKTVPPMEKHRYFFLNGSQTQKRCMRKKLRYPVIDQYPKAEKRTYDAGPFLPLHFADVLADGFGGMA